MKGSNVITGRMSSLNLSRFIDRQIKENGNIRVNIYETLRRRYNIKEATPEELELRVYSERDLSGMKMIQAAQLLIRAQEELVKANVKLASGERVTL